MDPHTAAKLDLAQIRSLVDDLLTAHTLCLPDWLKTARAALSYLTPYRRKPRHITPRQTTSHHKTQP
jgi:hypothetical protein